MNQAYMDGVQSLGIAVGGDDRLALKVIADHFIGNHPEIPYQFKTDFQDGIKMDHKGRYVFDFDSRFPQARVGECCVAVGKLWSYHARTTQFDLLCTGPTRCYVEGKLLFESDANEDGNRVRARFKVDLEKGFNEFLFITEKTQLGFGFLCGNFMPQWEPYLFQAPGEERRGQLGFVFSKPFGKEAAVTLRGTECPFPAFDPDFMEDEKEVDVALAFGTDQISHAYVKAEAVMDQDGFIRIQKAGDGQYTFSVDGGREIEAEEIKLVKGRHVVVVHIAHSAEKIRFEIQNGSFRPTVQVLGYRATWLYLGPFEEALPCDTDLFSMARVYGEEGEERYWKPLPTNMELRPCVESELFGRFTYPMGVTLYGLLKASEYLGAEGYKYAEYVKSGVEKIAKFHPYALFDRKRNGFPSLNHQICWLEELDDCGSFGSLMLECLKHWDIAEVRPLADRIADHMKNRQKRREDGAFCRRDNTMWIDDLYMSIPFLVRYYRLTDKEEYLNDACRQMLLYKQYFYIEEKKLMSHIYDINWEKANKIPWSRGNGWVIFSLSELLSVVPEANGYRGELEGFYNELARGIMDVQDESGMWHQVLDDPDTYLESSSTAMFICAFARGIREGYAEREYGGQMQKSVDKAWSGLLHCCIDNQGNLYGVCQGSGRSFGRDYYRNLSWRYNDAHGIGIVLLAGVEKSRMHEI